MYCSNSDLGALVVDVGTHSFRMGFAGDDYPKSYTRSSFGVISDSGVDMDVDQPSGKVSGKSNRDRYVFDSNLFTSAADAAFESLSIVNPMISYKGDASVGFNGLIGDWDKLEALWSYNLKQSLFASNSAEKSNCKEFPVLLAEKSYNLPQCRHRTLEFLFESQECPAVFLSKDAVLSCYSSGRTSGCIVDLGHSGCNISPVIDGFVEVSALNHSHVGGGYLDVMMNSLLTYTERKQSASSLPHYKLYSVLSKRLSRPPVLTPSLHSYLTLDNARDAKETLLNRMWLPDEIVGETGLLFQQTLKGSNDTISSAPPSSYELPDGTTVFPITLSDKFNICESLCDPAIGVGGVTAESLWRSEHLVNCGFVGTDESSNFLPQTMDSVPKLIVNTVLRSPADSMSTLLSNLIVVGGTSCIEGVPERLKYEVEKYIVMNFRELPSTLTQNYRIRQFSPAANEKKISAWLGGSILGSLSSFHDVWISKSEYEERGSIIVEKKCP